MLVLVLFGSLDFHFAVHIIVTSDVKFELYVFLVYQISII